MLRTFRRVSPGLFISSLHSIIIVLTTCLLFSSSAKGLAQEDSRDFEQIKKIFFQQEKDWNNGNIDAFMEAYWKSEELQFGNAKGIIRDWQQILDDYKIRYPDREAMGRVTFQILDMTKHSRKVVSMTGSWDLEREHNPPGGHFLLIWRKIDGDWKIVVDHTSQKEIRTHQ